MSIYDTLNDKQQQACFHTEGPLLLLAGAGSGKTRVLTHRVAYLLEKELAQPWQIMAITFTNKAAKEMRERVDSLIGHGGQDVWVSTFHSSCVRFLRRDIDKIGYEKNFNIYDTDDGKRIIKEAMKHYNMDPKQFKESGILSAISSAKNQMIGVDAFKQSAVNDFRKEKIAQCYEYYQKRLRKNNALDFDDLLFYTVELFRLRPDVLEYYQNKFKYIMVDEYQDTNGVQFKLVSQLAGKYKNLCVVGDDDQSIYRFRGADIRNILDFEKVYTDAAVIRLEQNYRSTKTILDAANNVIKHNTKRKEKRLWTDNEVGNNIRFYQADSEKQEARLIVDDILDNVDAMGKQYNDHAILYRTNAQSRVLEERLVYENVPYRIFGGTNFYQRKEIKDVLAYLRVINNSVDDLAVKRIINVPRRGIGNTTIEKIDQYAQQYDISFFEAIKQADSIPGLSRAVARVNEFKQLIMGLKTELEMQSNLTEFMELVLEKTGYEDALSKEGTDESKGRIENIGELVNKLVDFEVAKKEADEIPTLDAFLEEVALIADIDNMEENNNVVVLMTLHSAKGLEFPYVYMPGMEDGLFPSFMSIQTENPEDIEEERRLAYVGITRAQQALMMISAKSRMTHGRTQMNPVSRFVKEIPKELLEGDNPKSTSFTAGVSNTSVTPNKRDNRFFKAAPYQYNKPAAKKMPVNEKAKLDYGEGDLVKHAKFGVGQVVTVEPGGADYQVTVNFPSVGRKKLLAGLSGLKKMG